MEATLESHPAVTRNVLRTTVGSNPARSTILISVHSWPVAQLAQQMAVNHPVRKHIAGSNPAGPAVNRTSFAYDAEWQGASRLIDRPEGGLVHTC